MSVKHAGPKRPAMTGSSAYPMIGLRKAWQFTAKSRSLHEPTLHL